MELKSGTTLEQAAARVRQHLTQAAGTDGSLSSEELAAKLDELAPSERSAVDAFYSGVKNKLGATGQISLDAINQAIDTTQGELQQLAGGADKLSQAELGSLSQTGNAMVGLARKLRGEPGAKLDPIPRDKLAGLEGEPLRDAIRQNSARHVELGYTEARQVMFGAVDNKQGQVFDVYAGRTIQTQGIPEAGGPGGVNTEHTRPKSTGVKDTAAVSDLHHLFPTDTEANARRSSLPFGEVETVKWSKGESKLGLDKNGQLVFEPPEAHKGNVARSQFYVSTVYGLKVPDAEEAVLRQWNKLDPVDSAERQRNDAISAYQENRNAFVDDPELADRIKDF
ncbi:MAG: endonuclease [Pseudomonadota bacterium]